MKWLRKGAPHPVLAGIVIASAVFCLAVLCWRAGLFQRAELFVYDRFLTWRPAQPAVDSRITVVAITEEDIQRLKTFPVPDATLAAVLESVASNGPAAVGVDLFRDLQVGSAAEAERLSRVFHDHPNLLAIQRLGLGNAPSVAPPPFMGDIMEQVGFNDFSVDYRIDETARRALLIMDEGQNYYSMSLLAAMLFLQPRGMELEQDPAAPDRLRLGKAELRPFETNDGAYVGADARGYQVLLDFKGPRVFPVFTLHDVLEGKVPAEKVRGKVVLIGAIASSLKDALSTPLGERYPGVQLHAHVVDQLLRMALDGEPCLGTWSEWQEAFWILFWCAAGAVTGSFLRSPLFLSVALGGAELALFGSAWLAFRADWWLLVIAPGAAFAGAAVLTTSYGAYLERRERMLLMQLFSRHVSAEIAHTIWEQRDQFLEGGRPRSQKLTATVLFTDLKGFSTTSEGMPPERLIAWLNEYMEAMTAVVFQCGGVVNKFIGDSVMAIFGVPLARTAQEEIRLDAINAVRCALEMGRRLQGLNGKWSQEGMPTAAMRVGIFTGELVAGSLGSSERLEYTVIGDTVNTASRLESADKDSADPDMVDNPCRILVGESTRVLLGDAFDARQIGAMALRGKKEKITVFLVKGERIADKLET